MSVGRDDTQGGFSVLETLVSMVVFLGIMTIAQDLTTNPKHQTGVPFDELLECRFVSLFDEPHEQFGVRCWWYVSHIRQESRILICGHIYLPQ